VDTWAGDAHQGVYPDTIYRNLSSFVGPRYGRFATLLRKTFEQARPEFDNTSIDLLHIDGYHTLEAVTSDYNSWKDRMSDRGVILFHDLNVCERDYGVWRLWARLTQEYPSFTFDHGYGLGVLMVGQNVPEPLRRLASLQGEARSLVQRIYSTLGWQVQMRGAPIPWTGTHQDNADSLYWQCASASFEAVDRTPLPLPARIEYGQNVLNSLQEHVGAWELAAKLTLEAQGASQAGNLARDGLILGNSKTLLQILALSHQGNDRQQVVDYLQHHFPGTWPVPADFLAPRPMAAA
jgi:hypothetical protein